MSYKNKSRNKEKNPNSIKKIIKLGLLTFCCFTLLLGIVGFFRIRAYRKEAQELVNSSGRSAFSSNLTSIIYDKNGDTIASMSAQKDCYYLTYDNIPYMVKQAFVTTEDRKFYEHKGIDYKAILRACLAYVETGRITQGGSTITQQLARNIFLSHQVSLDRKIKEIFIAGTLEETYSKEELLEFYINNIYFGNGFYGIQAAAKGYFNQNITDLSLSEMIFLCAIPNNPTLYDPFQNIEETIARRDRILLQMYEQQNIDKQMYEEACTQTITLHPHKKEKSDYVETYVRHCAILSLMEEAGFRLQYSFDSNSQKDIYETEYNQLYNQFSNQLFTKGYRIYTSIDMDMQDTLQQILNDTLLQYSKDKNEEGIYTFQGAAVCIDNNTGYVNAIVGGRSQKYPGYTLNRAFQSHRQPGSAIKPILTYTPLLGKGYTAATIVNDEKIPDGPKNSPDIYEGKMTLREAIIKSKNTVAWSLYEKLGAKNALQYLKDMNFSKIDSRDYVLAASIGGMTYGTSALEMASAYSTLENKGIFRTPTCIIKITDNTKEVIVQDPIQTKTIYEENACVVMTDILKDVLKEGTGRHYQVYNADCAAKTGTTNGNRDSWLVGYSTYYTTAVWTGYDMPKNILDGVGNTMSGTIWQQFMTAIHQDKSYQEFPEYSGKKKEEESVSQWKSNIDNTSGSAEESKSSSQNPEPYTTFHEIQSTSPDEKGLYTENWEG